MAVFLPPAWMRCAAAPRACHNKHYPDAAAVPRKLNADHADYLQLLRELRELPGVKKVFVRSGIRFDYVLADRAKGEAFVRELCEHHVSGQLRVAPEHASTPCSA